MKKILFILAVVICITGCQAKEPIMYMKSSEISNDESVLLSAIGASIFEYQVTDLIKMITIRGTRYQNGESTQLLINHKIYVDETISNNKYKLLFMLSKSNRFFCLSQTNGDYSTNSEQLLEDISFDWIAKKEFKGLAEITPGIPIPLVIMTSDNQQPIYETSEYMQHPEYISMYPDIFLVTITFDTEWKPSD